MNFPGLTGHPKFVQKCIKGSTRKSQNNCKQQLKHLVPHLFLLRSEVMIKQKEKDLENLAPL